MKIIKLLTITLSSTLLFTSCCRENLQTEIPASTYDNGTLILNQGGFGNGNASISYLSNDFTVQKNNIFATANPSITLGDTAQDIGFYQNYAFIVVNNSNKIEIVNRYTMGYVATISGGLNNPRYIAFYNGKGYVTNWGFGSNPSDDFVAVIDLANYTVTNTISVLEGPEKIISSNGKLYVAQAGGFNFGNKISIINPDTNIVQGTIDVGDVPNSIIDYNNTLYVLCSGKPNYAPVETPGKLVTINLSSNTVLSTLDFPANTHPANLDILINSMYYTVNSSVYKTTLGATMLPTTSLFSVAPQGVNSIYSFALNFKNNTIYVGDAGDFNSNGKIYVYNSSGNLIHSSIVGIIPAGFYFN